MNEERLPGMMCTEALIARLQSSRAICLIALEDGADGSGGSAGSDVVGFVLCEASRGTCDVILLAVAAAATGRGIGRALLTVALAGAAAGGCTSAGAACTSARLTVHTHNPAALRLYTSLGFEFLDTTVARDGNASGPPPGSGGGAAQPGIPPPRGGACTMQWCLPTSPVLLPEDAAVKAAVEPAAEGWKPEGWR